MTSTLLGAASLLQKFAEEFAGLPVLSYSINTANEIPHCLMFQSYFKFTFRGNYTKTQTL